MICACENEPFLLSLEIHHGFDLFLTRAGVYGLEFNPVYGGGEATGGGPAAGVPAVAGGGAAGSAGAGGAAGDPGECVSRGAAAGRGVGGVAEGVGGSVGCEAGDGGLGRVQVGEEMREPGLPTIGVTRWWVGRDSAILTEPTSSQENCQKMRRLPPVGW